MLSSGISFYRNTELHLSLDVFVSKLETRSYINILLYKLERLVPADQVNSALLLKSNRDHMLFALKEKQTRKFSKKAKPRKCYR